MWAVGRISLLSWGRPQAPAGEVVAITKAAVAVLPAESDVPEAVAATVPEAIQVVEPRTLATAALRMQGEPATLVISVPDDVPESSDGEASRLVDDPRAAVARALATADPAPIGVIGPENETTDEAEATGSSGGEDLVAGATAPVEPVLESSAANTEGEPLVGLVVADVPPATDELQAAPSFPIADPTAADPVAESAHALAGSSTATEAPAPVVAAPVADEPMALTGEVDDHEPPQIVAAAAAIDEVAIPEAESLATQAPPVPESAESAPPIDTHEVEPTSLVEPVVETAPAPPVEAPDIEVAAATVVEPEPVLPMPIVSAEAVASASTVLPEPVPAPEPEIRVTASTQPARPNAVEAPANPVEPAAPQMGFLQRIFFRILNFFRAILGR